MRKVDAIFLGSSECARGISPPTCQVPSPYERVRPESNNFEISIHFPVGNVLANPNTKGDNRTFNLWFAKDGAVKASNGRTVA